MEFNYETRKQLKQLIRQELREMTLSETLHIRKDLDKKSLQIENKIENLLEEAKDDIRTLLKDSKMLEDLGKHHYLHTYNEGQR